MPSIEHRVDLIGVPGPDDLVSNATGLSGPSESRIDIRTIAMAPNASTPCTDAWVRLAVADDADGLGLLGTALVLVDALAPALLAGRRTDYLASTVALTAHPAPAREARADEWFHVSHRTLWSTPDLCLEDTGLHTAGGDLVLHARQTRRLLGDHGL